MPRHTSERSSPPPPLPSLLALPSPERSSHRATAAPHQACSCGRLGSQKPPTKGLKSLPALQLFQGSGVRGRACFPLAHQQLGLRLAAEAPFPLAEAQGPLRKLVVEFEEETLVLAVTAGMLRVVRREMVSLGLEN